MFSYINIGPLCMNRPIALLTALMDLFIPVQGLYKAKTSAFHVSKSVYTIMTFCNTGSK